MRELNWEALDHFAGFDPEFGKLWNARRPCVKPTETPAGVFTELLIAEYPEDPVRRDPLGDPAAHMKRLKDEIIRRGEAFQARARSAGGATARTERPAPAQPAATARAAAPKASTPTARVAHMPTAPARATRGPAAARPKPDPAPRMSWDEVLEAARERELSAPTMAKLETMRESGADVGAAALLVVQQTQVERDVAETMRAARERGLVQ